MHFLCVSESGDETTFSTRAELDAYLREHPHALIAHLRNHQPELHAELFPGTAPDAPSAAAREEAIAAAAADALRRERARILDAIGVGPPQMDSATKQAIEDGTSAESLALELLRSQRAAERAGRH